MVPQSNGARQLVGKQLARRHINPTCIQVMNSISSTGMSPNYRERQSVASGKYKQPWNNNCSKEQSYTKKHLDQSQSFKNDILKSFQNTGHLTQKVGSRSSKSTKYSHIGNQLRMNRRDKIK